MRMAQAAPLRRELPAPSRVQTLDSITGSESPWDISPPPASQTQAIPIAQSLPENKKAQRPSIHNNFPSEDYTQDRNPSKSPNMSKRKWFSTSRPRRGHEDVTRLDSDVSDGGLIAGTSELPIKDSSLGIKLDGKVSSTWNLPPQDVAGPSTISQLRPEGARSPPAWEPSPDLSIPEDNPWEEEISSSTKSAVGALSPDPNQRGPRRRSTEATLVDRDQNYGQNLRPYTPDSESTSEATLSIEDGTPSQEPGPSRTRKISWPLRRKSAEATAQKENKSPPLTSSQRSRVSPIMSRTISSQSSSPNPNPDVKNLYSGFCIGAYKMQVGFEKESLRLRNQSVSFGGEAHYWGCANSKCVFEGQAWKSGKDWNLSNAVRIRNGVQYRWRFLAKSHVALSKTTGRAFDYQCIFCISQGQQAAVYRTEPAFIEHVATHRGQRAGPLVSDKFCCIDDRVARPEEDFDINLTPHGTAQGIESHLQGKSLMASPEMTQLDTHTSRNLEGSFPWGTAGRFLGANV